MIKFVLALVLFPTAVSAHDWYPQNCCGGTDCKPVACDSIRSEENGAVSYSPKEAGYPPQLPSVYFFKKENVLPSLDNKCHVCINAGKATCAFIQQGS